MTSVAWPVRKVSNLAGGPTDAWHDKSSDDSPLTSWTGSAYHKRERGPEDRVTLRKKVPLNNSHVHEGTTFHMSIVMALDRLRRRLRRSVDLRFESGMVALLGPSSERTTWPCERDGSNSDLMPCHRSSIKPPTG
ncbi:hypothetical protein ACCO45_006616 [Purpureocillium lilacinum]|uniref:Uncharacterized protein n=1 Tax=Purpureocillium lilacinum TaxID=33203 RepID=A0ACC4DSC5_PURLI